MSSNGSNPPASEVRPNQRPAKNKDTTDFWRATRYLLPYTNIVIISIVSALFVGLTMAGGLGTMLPILSVLIRGDTVPNWVNRQIVQNRLDVRFASDADRTDLPVIHVSTDKTAANAGIVSGDVLAPSDTQPPVDQTQVLSELADPQLNAVTLKLERGRSVTVNNLPPVKWYWRMIRPILKMLPTGAVQGVATVLAFGVLISILGNTIRFFQEYLSDKAAILAINDIRRRMYDHVLHVPMSFYGAKGTSDVTSRLVQDCQGLQDGFKTVLGQSIQMPVNALFAFAAALFVSPKLTLFIVLFGPVMFKVIQKFGKKMRRASRKALQNSSSMLGQIEGTLTGIRVVKGSNAERFERRRYGRIMDGLSDQQLRMSRIDAFSSPVVEVLTLLVVCIVVIWATHLVREKHELNADQFIFVMVCLATIAESMRRMGKVNNVLQRSSAAASRIFETLAVPVERPRHMVGRDERPRKHLQPIAKDIRFENIEFSYPHSLSPALAGVNLTVPKGESVAIVGRNGSGKTTLAALLPRFYDPQVGRVLIDGVDIQAGTLKSLRDQISVVTQDSVIFPGTIAENIAYGHPMAARLNEKGPAGVELRAEVEAAAKRAFAHDFILEKPLGYQTVLGEMGGALSGGQKQRINIARAILRSAPILILDEATSQVDAESEHLIQLAIEQLMHERTMFVIAHRLNTIKSADRIVVMDRGRIVATGKHEELLLTSEAYNNLYERQLFAAPEKKQDGEPPLPAGPEVQWTAVDRYITDTLVPTDEALEAALRSSTAAGLPSINVAPNQGKLLQVLAQAHGAKKILEIGTLGGYSTIWLARALPPGGTLITLEVDEKHARVARENIANAGLAEVVTVRQGRAIDILPKLAEENAGPFDLIFIDADKVSTPEYFACALRLSRKGSVIVVDNVIRNGAVINADSTDSSVQGVRRFNDLLAAESRVCATAIQTVGSKGYDGFAIALVIADI